MTQSRNREIVAALIVGILLAAFAYSFLSSSKIAEAEYTVIDLSALGEGLSTRVFGFNSQDWLTGEVRTRQGRTRAFVWTPEDGLTVLGTLGGNDSYGRAINDAGQTVGYSDIEGRDQRAYLWTREEGMRDLGVLGGDRSRANSITWDGRVLGTSTLDATGEEHAFLWTENEGMRDLGTLGGKKSEVYSMNNLGALVGWSAPADRYRGRATIWTDTGEIVDLGTLGGVASTAFGIDPMGRVVGKAEISKNVFRAFLWSTSTGMSDLGTLGGAWSQAFSISPDGEIYGLASIGRAGAAGWAGEVGRWMTGGKGAGEDSRAVVWKEGKPNDLNDSIPYDSGWELIEAYAKNARGNILARGYHDGKIRSCYLIPRGAPNPFPDLITPSHDKL